MSDCEPMTAYGCDTRKARKDHRCCECRGTIKAGELYHYHHGVADGRGESYKVCIECDALRDEIDKGLSCYDCRT